MHRVAAGACAWIQRRLGVGFIMSAELKGLWPPVATPFADDGALNTGALARHGKALLGDGAAGLAILGTTSEANSLTLAERHEAIDACLEGGIAPDRLIAGTGACAVGEAGSLTRHVAEVGGAGALLLPPFYYKAVSDDGLFAFVAGVIEACSGNVPPIVLYHIPPIAVVGWSHEVIGRLIDAFPGVIAGIKDSSGDPEHTLGLIAAFQDLAVFPGAEAYLVRALAAGAAGCISATANINAAGIAALIRHWQDPDAEERQRAAMRVREVARASGMIPSVKAVLAARYRDDTWSNVRPPLMPLGEAQRRALLADPAIVALSKVVAA